MAGLSVCSVLLAVAVRVCKLCELLSTRSAPASPLARACALQLLCRDGLVSAMMPG